VRRARDTRLARLAAPAARADSAELLDRCALGARLTVCAIVRDRLTQAGIDSTRARALRLGEATESQRAKAAPNPAIPGSSPGRAREQFDDDGLAGMFAAKIGDMARRYQDGSEPDVAKASLAELFAWCLARPVPTPDTGAA
jgi:hypothetical protein